MPKTSVHPYNPDISNCVQKKHSSEWLSFDMKLALGLAKYDRKLNYIVPDLTQQHKNKLRLTLDVTQDIAGNIIPFVNSPRNISPYINERIKS